MSNLRFKVGAAVMCNLGPEGWKLGRIIALNYRESHWPPEKTAPYQVALDDDHKLIYVPVDDDRCCRVATREAARIAQRMDALAALPQDAEDGANIGPDALAQSHLSCDGSLAEPGNPTYRSGQCQCCSVCPQSWSYAELYSEHYRCAALSRLRALLEQHPRLASLPSPAKTSA